MSFYPFKNGWKSKPAAIYILVPVSILFLFSSCSYSCLMQCNATTKKSTFYESPQRHLVCNILFQQRAQAERLIRRRTGRSLILVFFLDLFSFISVSNKTHAWYHKIYMCALCYIWNAKRKPNKNNVNQFEFD